MQTKQDFEQTRNNLINFNKHCVQHNYQKESVKDYKIHFSRWIKSQKLTRKIKVENPYGEQVTIKK